MYKKILLICFVLLLCGCKKIDTNSTDYISFVNDCLSDRHVENDVALGYKFYVPRGVKKIHDYDYNQVFLIEDYSIYLYVDIISYYYKNELKYSKTGNEFYYQPINYNGKTGYLKIEQLEEQYFVTIVYHYSKIEVYVLEEDLSEILTLSSIILNNIEYNDAVIEKILEGDLGEFSEFTYEVDKPEDASSNFSQLLEEYVKKEEKVEEKLPDE